MGFLDVWRVILDCEENPVCEMKVLFGNDDSMVYVKGF